MATKTKQTKQSPIPQKYTSPLITVLVALLLAVGGWAIHETNQNHSALATKSKFAYVDGNGAVTQVSNFYRQYLADANKPDFQKKIVATYGSQNLAFYDSYYRHGFDPITCSATVPINVTASLISTGPVATVKALATYPDHTTATIVAKVVLTDALKVDSITCPGAKGNLPPEGTN